MADALTDLIDLADALADRCERTVPHTPGHAPSVAALRAASEDARRQAVEGARAEGMSWSAIAVVLGITTRECRGRFEVPEDPLDLLVPDDAA